MSGWGIADTTSEIEKIKAESADYLRGLNSCCLIDWNTYDKAFDFYMGLIDASYEQGKKDAERRWIPCTPDTMPEDLEEVYVTWVNHNPPWYYTEIKDKPFTAPAVYHRGKWYWYSSVCVDTLAEYGKNDFDEVDKDIEIMAWMPLPEPYGGEQE